MDILLAIDQGTSSSRAIGFSATGDLIAMAQQPFEQMPENTQNTQRGPFEPSAAPVSNQAAQPQAERAYEPRDASGEFVRADEGDRIIERRLAARDKQHAAELAKVKSLVPQLVVPAHAGGPGNDNHRPSWNLAEQEAAARGEFLDHWGDEPE